MIHTFLYLVTVSIIRVWQKSPIPTLKVRYLRIVFLETPLWSSIHMIRLCSTGKPVSYLVHYDCSHIRGRIDAGRSLTWRPFILSMIYYNGEHTLCPARSILLLLHSRKIETSIKNNVLALGILLKSGYAANYYWLFVYLYSNWYLEESCYEYFLSFYSVRISRKKMFLYLTTS